MLLTLLSTSTFILKATAYYSGLYFQFNQNIYPYPYYSYFDYNYNYTPDPPTTVTPGLQDLVMGMFNPQTVNVKSLCEETPGKNEVALILPTKEECKKKLKEVDLQCGPPWWYLYCQKVLQERKRFGPTVKTSSTRVHIDADVRKTMEKLWDYRKKMKGLNNKGLV